MTIVSLILLNFVLLAGSCVTINWLIGRDAPRPIRITTYKQKDGRR